MAEMKIKARAICETGRDGKGLTSRSEPSESVSSCQPGKVARSRRQTKAKMMAMILGRVSDCPTDPHAKKSNLHKVGKNNHILELSSEPDKVERVLVNINFFSQSSGIVTAQPGASIRVNADTEVTDTGL
jgi:hypothetical protein